MKKRFFSAILVFAMLFSLVGCAGSSPGSVDKESTSNEEEKVAVQANEKSAEPQTEKNDVFTLRLYTDKNSESYKALGEPRISLKTGIGGIYNEDYIRFVCDEDDVEVTLIELSYNDFRGEFDESDQAFYIKTNKGYVYEFKGYLGETMPPAKLKAKKGNYGAEFILQMNGKDSNTDFTIKSANMNG